MLELLSCPEIDVNYQVPSHGGTALHGKLNVVAFSNLFLAGGYAGNGQVVAMLLMKGADVAVQNKLGLTAHQEMRGEAMTAYKYYSQGDWKSLKETWPIVNVMQSRQGEWSKGSNAGEAPKVRKPASSKVRSIS